jgi:enamine deaminase RidA (YjgF/YER057c/UK114 family)
VDASIVRLNPPTLPDAGAMGYSQISVVAPGRMAYISGQVAWRPDGAPPPEDLVAQMRIVAANARAALEAVGATPAHIVIARCFMTDLTPDRLEALMPALLEFFDGAQPCVTGVGVAALAAPDLQVELELTVRLPD